MSAQLLLRFDAYSVKEFISRRASRVRVEVRSADEVRLVIPRWASRTQARQFLHSRQDWILRTLGQLLARRPHQSFLAAAARAAGSFPLRRHPRARASDPARSLRAFLVAGGAADAGVRGASPLAAAARRHLASHSAGGLASRAACSATDAGV